jgi:hypothetical protein
MSQADHDEQLFDAFKVNCPELLDALLQPPTTETMKSHELARILLSNPDMEVTTHANNHNSDRDTRVIIRTAWGSSDPVIGIGNYSSTETAISLQTAPTKP